MIISTLHLSSPSPPGSPSHEIVPSLIHEAVLQDHSVCSHVVCRQAHDYVIYVASGCIVTVA